MRKSDYYTDILRTNPAINPPYLTNRGRGYVFVLILLYILTGILLACSQTDLAEFFAAAAAAATLLLAILYTKAIICWKSIQSCTFTLSMETGCSPLQLHTTTEISCTLQNHLPWQIRIEAFRLAHTDHLQIHDEKAENIDIAPHSEHTLRLKARTQSAGKGRILGIGLILTDSTYIFYSENHIEQNETFSILPGFTCKKRHFAHIPASLLSGMKPSRFSGDDEIDRIRPWLSQDSIRRICWRGYAKRQELTVLQQTEQKPQMILLLIDAGPHMRVLHPDKTNPISRCLPFLARCCAYFETASIIVYDELHADIIANNLIPNQAIKKYERWLLETLEWQPPNQNSESAEYIWKEAAEQLHLDYKLYKQVDFSRPFKNGIRIDLRGLICWAAADLAAAELERNHPAKASDLLKKPYLKLLTFFIRRRCKLQNTSLPPNTPTPDLNQAVQAIFKIIRRQQPQGIVWISDFAVPLESQPLDKLFGFIRKSRISAIAASEPMPEHCLNFNIHDGRTVRESNFQKLRTCMEIWSQDDTG